MFWNPDPELQHQEPYTLSVYIVCTYDNKFEQAIYSIHIPRMYIESTVLNKMYTDESKHLKL